MSCVQVLLLVSYIFQSSMHSFLRVLVRFYSRSKMAAESLYQQQVRQMSAALILVYSAVYRLCRDRPFMRSLHRNLNYYSDISRSSKYASLKSIMLSLIQYASLTMAVNAFSFSPCCSARPSTLFLKLSASSISIFMLFMERVVQQGKPQCCFWEDDNRVLALVFWWWIYCRVGVYLVRTEAEWLRVLIWEGWFVMKLTDFFALCRLLLQVDSCLMAGVRLFMEWERMWLEVPSQIDLANPLDDYSFLSLLGELQGDPLRVWCLLRLIANLPPIFLGLCQGWNLMELRSERNRSGRVLRMLIYCYVQMKLKIK